VPCDSAIRYRRSRGKFWYKIKNSERNDQSSSIRIAPSSVPSSSMGPSSWPFDWTFAFFDTGESSPSKACDTVLFPEPSPDMVPLPFEVAGFETSWPLDPLDCGAADFFRLGMGEEGASPFDTGLMSTHLIGLSSTVVL
jgi:hypothetical protein